MTNPATSLKSMAATLAFLVITSLVVPWPAFASGTVKVGILHSLTGTVAVNEIGVARAERLAISEINASGGVLGKQIERVEEDGASDWPTFTLKAEKLLIQDKVAVVFGCYTTASRKAVKPVFEREGGVLFYPTFYEGLEASPNIVYVGMEAHQQVISAIEWIMREKGAKSFYIVGSDYLFPQTCSKIAKATIRKLGGRIVGEDLLPLGHDNFKRVISKIVYKDPDVVLNFIVGDSNFFFYHQLPEFGLSPKKDLMITFAFDEDLANKIGLEVTEGVYSSSDYFQSIKSPTNQAFVAAMKRRYGKEQMVGPVMQCGYIAVYLWKMAVEKAGSFEPDKVLQAVVGLEIEAPEGHLKVHENRHLYKFNRIGRLNAQGMFDILNKSGTLTPNPFLIH